MRVARDRIARGGVGEQELFEVDAFDRRFAVGGDQRRAFDGVVRQVHVERRVVLQVQLVLALLDLVQRRQADVDVAALDQLRHLPIEERQQQRADVRAVDVGVGHQDDAVVAQLVRVVFVLADAGAERGDQRADFRAAEHAVEARAFHVEDLALERQDRLRLAVAALLRRTAGRVALDDEQFGQRRILFLAVGELAGQAGDIERALAAGEVARLARGFARTGGVDDLGRRWRGPRGGVPAGTPPNVYRTCSQRPAGPRTRPAFPSSATRSSDPAPSPTARRSCLRACRRPTA